VCIDSWGTTEDNSFNDMLINQNEEEGIPPKAFDSMLLTLQKLLFASYTSGTITITTNDTITLNSYSLL